MQHNEDLCVTDGSGVRLQGIGINKHMQCTDIRELLYTENSKALIVITVIYFFSSLKHDRVNK